jgi:hypothetical protein
MNVATSRFQIRDATDLVAEGDGSFALNSTHHLVFPLGRVELLLDFQPATESAVKAGQGLLVALTRQSRE